jgi:hypothetical protein
MRLFPALASFASLLLAASAQAATWPGAAPCAGTLQTCIDGVPAGETVIVDSVAPVVEDLTISKSLTLTSQVGNPATLVGNIVLESGLEATSITFSDLLVEGNVQGFVRESDLDLHLLGNLIVSQAANRSAVELQSFVVIGSAGSLTAEVRGNEMQVNSPAPSDVCGGVLLLPGSAASTAVSIVGNTFFVSGCEQGAAVSASVGANTATVDVLRNDILVPNTGRGIILQHAISGNSALLAARVVGNLVRGEFFGVGITVLDATDGPLTIDLVNNTVVEHLAGVMVIGNTGAPMSGEVANNVVAFNDEDGLRIDLATVTNRNNLVFGNGSESFTPGPGTLTADPEFFGGANFHLLATSPAIDAGANDAVPGDVTLDLDGAARIQGAAVDLGAFEELGGAPAPPQEVPALSAVGLGLLALLLALGATRLLRRA